MWGRVEHHSEGQGEKAEKVEQDQDYAVQQHLPVRLAKLQCDLGSQRTGVPAIAALEKAFLLCEVAASCLWLLSMKVPEQRLVHKDCPRQDQ